MFITIGDGVSGAVTDGFFLQGTGQGRAGGASGADGKDADCRGRGRESVHYYQRDWGLDHFHFGFLAYRQSFQRLREQQHGRPELLREH